MKYLRKLRRQVKRQSPKLAPQQTHGMSGFGQGETKAQLAYLEQLGTLKEGKSSSSNVDIAWKLYFRLYRNIQT